jgi:hypothetical protein
LGVSSAVVPIASILDDESDLSYPFFQNRNVRATFLQNFTIAGGPNGLMNRSEEVVQINVINCSDQGLNLSSGDLNLSPRMMIAGSIGRKLRRGVSHDVGTNDEAFTQERADSYG